MFLINKKLLNIIYLLFLLLFIVEIVYVYSYETTNKDFTTLLIIELFVIYFISIFYCIGKYGVKSVFTFFLICLALFNFQKFFWDYFLVEDFRRADSLININLKENVVHKTILVFCLFTQIISWTYFSLKGIEKNNDFRINLNTDIKLYKAGLKLFYLTLPFVLYKSYIEVTSLIGKAYTEYYISDDSENTPFYLRFALLVFQVSFMVILASIPPVKRFRFFAALYLVTIIPYLFIGLRANFAVTIIFLFWYYSIIYKIRINLKKLIPISFALLIILQSISFSRSNVSKEINIFKMVPYFLYEQSQSMYVLSLFIQYQDAITINKKPYVLDPLFSWLYPSGQSVEVALERSSLGHSLAYSLSPDYYLSGASLGTNSIAELYEFGIFGVFFGAILLGGFILFFEKKIKNSRLYLFLAFGILQYLFLVPRSSYLLNVYYIFKILLIYFLILVAFNIYDKKKYFN